jgi:hypothetical protein
VQGCAVAASVLLVLACLWPALRPVWTAPPLTLATTPLPTAYASILPVPAPSTPPTEPAAPAPAAPSTGLFAPQPIALPPTVIPQAPPTSPGWTLWYHNPSGPAWGIGSVQHGTAFHPPAPVVRGYFPTAGACQEALAVQFGPQLTRLAQLSMGGKNVAVGKVERSPNKYHWEQGFTTNGQVRTVYEAWCAESAVATTKVD